MKIPSARRVRQVVQHQGQTIEQVVPALNRLMQFAAKTEQDIKALESFRHAGLVARLRWLFTGQ